MNRLGLEPLHVGALTGEVLDSDNTVSVVLRRTVLAEEEWGTLFPVEPAPEARSEWSRRAAQRELDAGFGRLRVSTAKEPLDIKDYEAYWERFLEVCYAHLMAALAEEEAAPS